MRKVVMFLFFILSFYFVFAGSEIDSSFLIRNTVVPDSYSPPFINYIYNFIWVAIVFIFILFRMKKSSNEKVSKVKKKRKVKIKSKKK
ncbi:MAG: hypothetical protein V1888_03085 [archaeon]